MPTQCSDEQRAIAKVLSDVDGLINALDALIAKKRAIKQATMQQLLTGKTRLPGFSGAWETKRLGKLGTFSKGRGIKRDPMSLTIVSATVFVTENMVIHEYQDYILKASHTRIPPGVAETAGTNKTYPDLVICRISGETTEEIGRCSGISLVKNKHTSGGDVNSC